MCLYRRLVRKRTYVEQKQQQQIGKCNNNKRIKLIRLCGVTCLECQIDLSCVVAELIYLFF